MRNLKRALSLALASVMLVGMMVVGTSAASFPDVDDSYNVEAIEVLNAVEVMIGDNGDFRPDDNVTRNEMAVIMAKLLLGKDADKYVGSHPFTDVPEWADKYVAACYNEGIVAGVSETEYDGQSTVTAEQAAAMMLRALGYEKLEGTGADWARPVVAKANNISLFKDVGSNPKAPMTRNQIAQLSLNTLQATMVTSDIEQDIIVEGVVTIPGKVTYEDRYSTETAWNGAITGGTPDATKGLTVQLGEYLYKGDLRKAAGDDDDFGRPADHAWTMKGVSGKVGNATKEPVATFTGDTSASDVASALSGYYQAYTDGTTNVPIDNKTDRSLTLGSSGTTISVSGETIAEAIADETANGKVLEFYADAKNVIDNIVVITYRVAEVTNVRETSKGTTYTVTPGGTGTVYNPDEDETDTAILAGDVAKNDIVTVATCTVDGKTKLYIYPTTSFEGVQSSRNTNKGTIVVDGTTYDVGVGLTNVNADLSGFANSKDSATFYVDQYGYVVKSEAIEDSSEYAVVDEIRYVSDGAIGSSKSVEARLVFTDGTSEIVKVTEVNEVEAKNITVKDDVTNTTPKFDLNHSSVKIVMSTTASDNTIMTGQVVKYTKSGSDYKIEYQLNSAKNAVETTSQATISSGNAVTKGVPAFGTSSGNGTKDTVYIIKTDDAKYSMYTGYQNVTTVTYKASNNIGMSWIKDDDGKVAVVYVDASKSTLGDASTEVVYILDYKAVNEYKNDDDEVRYEYTKAVLNGDDSASVISRYEFTKNGIYEVKLTDGDPAEIKGGSDAPVFETLTGYTKAAVSADNTDDAETMYINGKGYNVADADVYVIDDKAFSVGDGTSGAEGDVVFVKVKGTFGNATKDDITVEKIYVIKDADKARANSVADVTKQFTQNDKKEVTLTAALGSSTVSVPAGKKLVLEATTTAGGTVNLGKGATVELKNASGVLPTITGEGSVVVSGTATMTDDSKASIEAIGGKSVEVENTGANASVAKSTVSYSGDGKVSTFSSATLKSVIEDIQNNGSTTVSPYYVKLPSAVCTSGTAIKGFRHTADGGWVAMAGAFVADGNSQDQEFFLMEGDKVDKICFVIGAGTSASSVTTNMTDLPIADYSDTNTTNYIRIIEISFTAAG